MTELSAKLSLFEQPKGRVQIHRLWIDAKILGMATEPLTDAQETALQAINDKWGVARWTLDRSTGILAVELDDGEEGEIRADGSNTWGA